MAREKGKEHSQRAHAKFSASGSSRWINCSGSIALSEKAPEPPTSEYAEEGTKAHECLEFILNEVSKGHKLKVASENAFMDEADYDEDMVKYAEKSAKYILDRYYKESENNPYVSLEVESRVDASSFTCEGQFGTLDIAIVDEFGKLIIMDYKYGAGIAVDPDENSQLIYYALGKSAEYDHNFTDVELVVVQPRAYHPSGETIRSWSTKMSYLLDEWVPIFKKGVKDCLKKDAEKNLNAGSWCQFCPAAPMCPELSKKALEQAQIVFDDVTGEGELEEVPDVESLPINNLPNILSACDRLETWIKEVRRHAYGVMERGAKVDGFKLVEKRPTQKWNKRAQKIAPRHFNDKAFEPPKLKSPAQFREAFKKDKKAQSFLRQYTTKESSGLTLVSEDDKRPATDGLKNNFTKVDE